MIEARKGDVVVLVGTMKGAFLLRSDGDRGKFEVDGPHFPGHIVYAMALDTRGGRNRILAAPSSMHWGPVVRWSDDFGATWADPAEGNVKFPEDTGASLNQVWQLMPGSDAHPDVVWAGVEPAALFRSEDGGEHFELVRGLWDHEHRPRWQPGGGGLCLHTVLPHPTDPERMMIAISSAGVYRTEDGGATWKASNRGINADFLPHPDVEFGQCVHKVAPAAGRPERFYLQHHGGVYRSDDGGATWRGISSTLPSDFGFPIVAHPSDPDTAWVVPLNSSERRWTIDGQARVFRTRDAGATWEPLGDGLPSHDAYLTVLRDAFATDGMEEPGLYFGTRTGQVYGSSDAGEHWRLLTDLLPPVTCVKAVVIP